VYKAPWLTSEIKADDKRVLMLSATAGGGETTVQVFVPGDSLPLQLLVRASPKVVGTHVYVVGCPAGAAAVVTPSVSSAAAVPAHPSAPGKPAPSPSSAAVPQPQAQAPAQPQPVSATAWDAFTGTLTARQWTLLSAFVASPTASTESALATTLTPAQQPQWVALRATITTGTAPAAEKAPLPLPSWLAWNAHATPSPMGTLVAYSVQNTGQATVVLDIARLTITSPDGTPLGSPSLSRQDTSGYEGRVPPGGAESGVIRLPASGDGKVTLAWAVVATGSPQATYQIEQAFP